MHLLHSSTFSETFLTGCTPITGEVLIVECMCRAEEIHKDLNNIAKSSNSTESVRYLIAEPAKSYAGYLADCGRAMIGPSSPPQHATSALRQASKREIKLFLAFGATSLSFPCPPRHRRVINLHGYNIVMGPLDFLVADTLAEDLVHGLLQSKHAKARDSNLPWPGCQGLIR